MVALLLGALAVGLLGPLWRPRCPECRGRATRVIHHALPVWFCFKHEEPITFGAWAWVIMELPFDGHLLEVRGPYLPGLWNWFRHEHDD